MASNSDKIELDKNYSNKTFNQLVKEEMITVHKDIGVCIDNSGKAVTTKRFMLHYSKTGTHIVPTLKER